MTKAGAGREASVALLLMAIYVLWALFCAMTVFLSSLSIAGCGQIPCDYELQARAVNTFLLVDAAVFLIAGALFAVRRHRGQRSWWVPAASILITLIAWVVAHQLSRIGLFLPS